MADGNVHENGRILHNVQNEAQKGYPFNLDTKTRRMNQAWQPRPPSWQQATSRHSHCSDFPNEAMRWCVGTKNVSTQNRIIFKSGAPHFLIGTENAKIVFFYTLQFTKLKKPNFWPYFCNYWMNQIFPGKSGFVSFLLLLSYNFKPSFGKILWSVIEKSSGQTDGHGSIYRTNLYVGGSKNTYVIVETFLCYTDFFYKKPVYKKLDPLTSKN